MRSVALIRVLWSVPSAVVAWFVVGFAPFYLGGLPEAATTFVPSGAAEVDVLVLGGLAGGVAAGLLVCRLLIAIPLVLVVAVAGWWLSDHRVEPGGLFISLLTASVLGAVAGALGTRSSVFAAFALALPVAAAVAKPAEHLTDWRWNWQLNGLLVAIGLAVLLYVACWRRGWPSAYYWLPVAAAYLGSFGVVAAGRQVATGFATGRSADDLANGGTDAFFSSFVPFLQAYWPWLIAALLLAIPMVALKVRALPPVPPRPDDPGRYDDRGNDARLSDDLDWVDRPEPRRRRLPRREPVG